MMNYGETESERETCLKILTKELKDTMNSEAKRFGMQLEFKQSHTGVSKGNIWEIGLKFSISNSDEENTKKLLEYFVDDFTLTYKESIGAEVGYSLDADAEVDPKPEAKAPFF